jgi:prepilin-type N-terminal cleavage/methylation domain-containing protein
MKPDLWNPSRISLPGRGNAAFTLVELMVASSISLLVMGGAMTFLWFSGLGASGVAAQALCNQQAGNALEFIQSRARLAVCVSNDSTGNVLTFGFDDDPTTDSDGDGIPYNDKNHYERFQFIGLNGSTNNCSTNRLVYIPNISNTNTRTLISAGVRNLPGSRIFSVTNGALTIIRFGVVDTYAMDRYQSIDIQATAVPLNRTVSTNVIAIFP